MKYDLLNKVYDEHVKFEDVDIGKSVITSFEVVNPYRSIIGLKAISEDKDVKVLYCPEKLGVNEVGIIKLEYTPSEDRDESLIGKLITIKVAL